MSGPRTTAQPQRTHWEGCEEVHPECRKPEQKPVAWVYRGNFHPFDPSDWAEEPATPLYTTPPRREWVGLTEEEQEALWDEAVDRQEHFCSQYGEFADAIEAKLKEKNA